MGKACQFGWNRADIPASQKDDGVFLCKIPMLFNNPEYKPGVCVAFLEVHLNCSGRVAKPAGSVVPARAESGCPNFEAHPQTNVCLTACFIIWYDVLRKHDLFWQQIRSWLPIVIDQSIQPVQPSPRFSRRTRVAMRGMMLRNRGRRLAVGPDPALEAARRRR